jgi:hypothetical protein
MASHEGDAQVQFVTVVIAVIIRWDFAKGGNRTTNAAGHDMASHLSCDFAIGEVGRALIMGFLQKKWFAICPGRSLGILGFLVLGAGRAAGFLCLPMATAPACISICTWRK